MMTQSIGEICCVVLEASPKSVLPVQTSHCRPHLSSDWSQILPTPHWRYLLDLDNETALSKFERPKSCTLSVTTTHLSWRFNHTRKLLAVLTFDWTSFAFSFWVFAVPGKASNVSESDHFVPSVSGWAETTEWSPSRQLDHWCRGRICAILGQMAWSEANQGCGRKLIIWIVSLSHNTSGKCIAVALTLWEATD